METAIAYRSMIDAIVTWSGSANLMHVHAGMAIYVAAQLVLRDRRGSLVALHVVFLAEMVNEVLDWIAPRPGLTLGDSLSDVVLTMMWPVATAAVSHYRRKRWQQTKERRRSARRESRVAPDAIAWATRARS